MEAEEKRYACEYSLCANELCEHWFAHDKQESCSEKCDTYHKALPCSEQKTTKEE